MKADILYNDEKYFVIFNVQGKTALSLNIVDESYLSVTDEVYNGVLNKFIDKLDFDKMTNEEIFSWLKIMKPKNEDDKQSSKGCFARMKVCEYYLKKNDNSRDAVLRTLSIYLSCMRKLGFSQKAYDYFNKIRNDYEKYIYEPIAYTVIAAVCCDLNKYEEAMSFANKAYAMQGGGMGYTNELSLVYARIKKESGLSGV